MTSRTSRTLILCTTLAALAAANHALAKDPVQPANGDRWQEPVAVVNGEPITAGDLAAELIAAYGKEHLDLMVNRKLVEQACAKAGIEIGREDLEQEMAVRLERLKVSKENFIKRVLAENDVSYSQYLRDTIWPAVALARLVQAELTVGPEELQKAFEARYGKKVECRLMILGELHRAQQVWEQVRTAEDPQQRIALFEELTKKYSVDTSTRSFGGKVVFDQHTSNPDIEELAFGLKEGELSTIRQVPQGSLILLCVQHVPAAEGVTLETVVDEETKQTIGDALEAEVRERKERFLIAKRFQTVRQGARIDNYLTGEFDAAKVEPAQLPK